MDMTKLATLAASAAVLSPLLAAALVGATMFAGREARERAVALATRAGLGLSFAGALALTWLWSRMGGGRAALDAGDWYALGEHRFALGFIVDRTGLAMLWLDLVLGALVARFSKTYLHREPGFGRYHLLLLMAVGGVADVAVAATWDQLFLGWELTGLASVFLVGFYPARPGPSRAAARVFIAYRACDVGLLFAIAGLHHHLGAERVLAAQSPEVSSLAATHPVVTTLLALGLVAGAAGKAAQLPVSGWLPRAMEGPTPSSAIFYGGVSVHAGIYLLLRGEALLALAPAARGVAVCLGLATALWAWRVGRVQADAKGALAYATLTQLGLLFAEASMGWHTLAVVHMGGHAILRTGQFLRVPSTLHARLETRAALAAMGAAPGAPPEARSAAEYHAALSRYGLDALLERLVHGPLVAAGRTLERLEQRYEALLCGDVEDAPVEPQPQPQPQEPPR